MSNMPRFEMLHEREGHRFDDDVVERDLPALFPELLVERFARLRGALHVDLGRQEEMWNRAERCRQTLRNRLPDLREGYVFVRNPCARCAVRGARGGLCSDRGCGGPFHVALDYTPAGTGP